MKNEININNYTHIQHDINELYIQAVRNDNVEQVKWCVSNGANINYQKDMALDTAVIFNNFEVLKFLVKELKLDPKQNEKCMYQAARNNNVPMLRFLVEDCHCSVIMTENRPIKNAVIGDSLEAFLYLKEKGAPLNHIEIEENVLKPKKLYKVNTLTNLAWQFTSEKCLMQLLDINKKTFFSKNNINEELNAKDLIPKIKENPSIVSFVINKLLDYKPESMRFITESVQKLSHNDADKFNKWLSSIYLDRALPHKSLNSKKMKI